VEQTVLKPTVKSVRSTLLVTKPALAHNRIARQEDVKQRFVHSLIAPTRKNAITRVLIPLAEQIVPRATVAFVRSILPAIQAMFALYRTALVEDVKLLLAHPQQTATILEPAK
jgi:hypothetical protein